MTSTTTQVFTSGVLFVHSCPKAVASHVEWALARAVGTSVTLHWTPQPLQPDTVRAEANWRGPVGTAASVASSLFGWSQVRFEITEHQTAESDGGRWMHTPSLGIFHMRIDSAGNGVLGESQLRAALDEAGDSPLRVASELRRALGDAWDAELEPFRSAEPHDARIAPLHRAG